MGQNGLKIGLNGPKKGRSKKWAEMCRNVGPKWRVFLLLLWRHGGDVEKNRRLAEPDGNWAGNDRKWAINGLKL